MTNDLYKHDKIHFIQRKLRRSFTLKEKTISFPFGPTLLCHKLLSDSDLICHVWRFLTVEAVYGSQGWMAWQRITFYRLCRGAQFCSGPCRPRGTVPFLLRGITAAG